MKNLILLLVFISAAQFANAQNEVFKTAKWKFHLYASDFYEEWHEEMSYEKDTVINGETWQKFTLFRKVEQYKSVCGTPGYWVYTKRNYKILQWEGNRIYHSYDYGQSKFLLYDFDALPGDSWQYGPSFSASSCPDTNMFQVDTIGVDTINGAPVKWFKGHNINMFSSDIMDTNKIYQNVGSSIGIFSPTYNPNCIVHPPKYSFTCYQDTVIGNYSLNTARCQLYDVLSITEVQLKTIEVYPNPSSRLLNINADQSIIENISIYSILGEKVREEKYSTPRSEVKLDLDKLKNGVYFVSLNDKRLVKWIKTN